MNEKKWTTKKIVDIIDNEEFIGCMARLAEGYEEFEIKGITHNSCHKSINRMRTNRGITL